MTALSTPGGVPLLDDAHLAIILRRTKFPHLNDEQFEYMLAQCQKWNLDPWLDHVAVVAVPGLNGARSEIKVLIKLQALREKAEQTGEHRGREGPQWCGRDGVWKDVWLDSGVGAAPYAARVGIRRRGKRIFWGVAYWDAYCPTAIGEQGRTIITDEFWIKGGYGQLAKCFDEETEVLTTAGFERFSAVTGKVLQVTADGLDPCDARPFSQSYVGEMVTMDSDDLNFCVTPNHDMITSSGRMEASVLWENARAKARHWIPRCIQGSRPDAPISDESIMLAAAYLCDGSDLDRWIFKIEVSRQRKKDLLNEIGLFHNRRIRHTAGDASNAGTRTIVTRKDKLGFMYRYGAMAPFVGRGKSIDLVALTRLSRRQARLFAETLQAFDGNTVRKSGVKRFYNSRPSIIRGFEIAAVVGGLSVSDPKLRQSDIGRPNTCLTISERNEIPISRWGRFHHRVYPRTSLRIQTGLTLTNCTGRVWCVTVPSGVIVVRRHGFSMLCGNCAEALAIRAAFPMLGALYTNEEMAQAMSRRRGDAGAARREQGDAGEPVLDDGGDQLEDSTPTSEMQFQLRLFHDFDLGNREQREATIEHFKGKYAALFIHDRRRWWATVLQELRQASPAAASSAPDSA